MVWGEPQRARGEQRVNKRGKRMRKLPSGWSNRSSAFLLSLTMAGMIFGQTTHFTFTAKTGSNMTLMVPRAINPTINGKALQSGDEIGVFTTGGLCVGASVWPDTGNIPLTAWGWDSVDAATVFSGARAGEVLEYRIWNKSAEIPATASYSNSQPFYSATGAYSTNGIAVLSSLTAVSLPQPGYTGTMPAKNTPAKVIGPVNLKCCDLRGRSLPATSESTIIRVSEAGNLIRISR